MPKWTQSQRYRAMLSRLRIYIVGSLLVVAPLVSCHELTNVSDPDITQPNQLTNPSGAVASAAGALSDFANAVALQVLVSGIISDELSDYLGGFQSADRRVLPAYQGDGYPYDALSQARIDLLIAIGRLNAYAPIPRARIGELYAGLGYIEIAFAENMCNGVPLGAVSNGTPQLGPTLTRAGLLQQALIDLDSASVNSSGSDSISYLASVEKGRAELDLGNFGQAARAVNGVPLSFSYSPAYDGLVQSNVFASELNFQLGTVSNHEGGNGLGFVTDGDPRVQTVQDGTAPNGVTPLFAFPAYTSSAASIPIASGTEASLISAEAALQAGQTQMWRDTLNWLRSSFSDTALSNHLLPDDSTVLATDSLRVNVMFRERAFWLFGTGHRFGDLRRLVRQYGRSVSATFPVGLYQGGPQVYGSDVTVTPFGEQSNPNFHGCIDRNA